MRLSNRELSLQDAKKVLTACEYGVLSVCDAGAPYAVPINYVYAENENCIYLHCATEGHKLEVIRQNPCATLVAVSEAEVHGSRYTTKYKSAIACGSIEVVTDKEEWYQALTLLSDRFLADGNHKPVIEKYASRVLVLKLCIHSLSGKFNNG